MLSQETFQIVATEVVIDVAPVKLTTTTVETNARYEESFSSSGESCKTPSSQVVQ